MAKNFCVVVDPDGTETKLRFVVVRTMLEATGLAASNLSKQRTVTISRTEQAHTHSTGNAAQAYIDVELFQLVSDTAA